MELTSDPSVKCDPEPKKESIDDEVEESKDSDLHQPESNACVDMAPECINFLCCEKPIGDEKDPSMAQRMKIITSQFFYYVNIPSDGNCMYRTVLFGFLNYKNNEGFHKKVATVSAEAQEFLVSLGYSEVTISDFFEEALEFAQNVSNAEVDLASCFEALRIGISANYLVMFLRLTISAHIMRKADSYAPFLPEGVSPDEYCKKNVEPMGRSAGEIELAALADIFDMHIRVYSRIPATAIYSDYPYDSVSEPVMNLLYSPNHYQLLSKKPHLL